MKILIIFSVLICCGFSRAQSYEKEWAILHNVMESGGDLNLKQSEAFITKYKKQFEKEPDKACTLYSYMAYDYYSNSEFVKCEESYGRAYHYALSAADTSLKYIALYRLADFYQARKNYTEAEKFYLACMRPLASILGQSGREYTQIFYNYTTVIIELGKYSEAGPYVDALLYYYKTLDGEKNDKYVSLLNYKAIVAQNTGEYEIAIEIFSDIVSANRYLEINDTAAYITGYNNLGNIYREVGKYDLAILNLKKAKQEFYRLKIKDMDHLSSIQNNLGLCYKAVGNTKEAEEAYNDCIRIHKEINDINSESYSTVLNNKGDLLRELGRNGEASEVLLASLEIRKKNSGTNSARYANALSNLAIVYFNSGYIKEALELNLQAEEIYASTVGEGHQWYGNVLSNLSGCYMEMKDYKKAGEYKLKALQVTEQSVGKDHYRYSSYLISACGLYFKTRQYAKAEINLREALRLAEKNFGKKHELYAHAGLLLAEIYSLTGRLEQAGALYFESLDFYTGLLNDYFDAMSEENQMQYYNFIAPVFESYNNFLLNYRLSKPDKDLNAYIKRSLNQQLLLKSLLTGRSARLKAAVYNSSDRELINIYQEWVKVQNELINNSKSQTPDEKINELSKRSSSLEAALKARTNVSFKSGSVTFESIKSALAPNEAALEIFRVNEWTNDSSSIIKYGALLIKKNDIQPELVIFKEGNLMEDAYFSNFNACIDDQLTDTLSYGAYFKNLARHLNGVTKIFVSAEGIYQKINLSGLYDPLKKNYVHDKYDICYLPNISSLIHKKPETKGNSRSAALFGYPDYEYDFKNETSGSKAPAAEGVAKRFGLTNLDKLPGTKKEAEAISAELKDKKWNVMVYTDKYASEENLRKTNSPNVLHIATHGYYLKNIETEDRSFMGFESRAFKENSLLRSGIILAGAGPATTDSLGRNAENDGILTAYEASLLNLANTDLVVLSACQTGLGDDYGSQGVAGLQRSFAIAGVKNIIMSLWPVDDEATQYLMTEFYKNYAATQKVETSFKLARAKVKTKYAHPYFWAAFVLLKTLN